MTHRDGVLAALRRFDERAAAGKVKAPRGKPRKYDPDAVSTEYQEQAMFVDWMKAKGIVYFAVPNHLKPSERGLCERCVAVLRRNFGIHVHAQKRVGMRSGVPDLIVVTRPPKHPAGVVAVEMKRTKDGRLTDKQKERQVGMLRCGWTVIVGYGADDAIRQMKGLGYGDV